MLSGGVAFPPAEGGSVGHPDSLILRISLCSSALAAHHPALAYVQDNSIISVHNLEICTLKICNIWRKILKEISDR